MANTHFLNVKYSIDEANGHYAIDVKPGEDPGMTSVVYREKATEHDSISVDLDQLPLLIEALQRRLIEATREVEEAYGPAKKP